VEAIALEAVSKQYRIGIRRNKHPTLRFAIADATTKAVRRAQAVAVRTAPGNVDPGTIWALKDASFEIQEGEAVGIIGRNGSGKTTLLKILSRVTEPTRGRFGTRGRVGSLLEVGTGFHPELTGRENVFLYGAILGMPKAEIQRRFDEIVEFAEISTFLDTPIKRYSSGMSVRLAFAVAAHLEPEILLVDEVLAVGDLAFQKKCLGKMGHAAREGSTVLFVSHNMALIHSLCERGIFLELGRVLADATVEDAVGAYLRTLEEIQVPDLLERTDRRGKGQVLLTRIEIAGGEAGAALATGRPARFVFHVTEAHPRVTCTFTIYNNLGQRVARLTSAAPSPADEVDRALGPKYVCEIEALPLTPGRYRLDAELGFSTKTADALEAAAIFDVEAGTLGGRPVSLDELQGDVAVEYRWRLPVD
jgi:lipopolysaccharide transport system ATP-binding protein